MIPIQIITWLLHTNYTMLIYNYSSYSYIQMIKLLILYSYSYIQIKHMFFFNKKNIQIINIC